MRHNMKVRWELCCNEISISYEKLCSKHRVILCKYDYFQSIWIYVVIGNRENFNNVTIDSSRWYVPVSKMSIQQQNAWTASFELNDDEEEIIPPNFEDKKRNEVAEDSVVTSSEIHSSDSTFQDK